MRRPTAYSTVFTSMRAAFAGAIVLAAAVSCDTYTTSVMQTPTPGFTRVRVHSTQIAYTPAQKDSIAAAAAAGNFTMMVPLEPIANVVGAPKSAAATVAACGGPGTFNGYSVSQVEWAPEQIPTFAPYPIYDDGILNDTPLGFSFNFQGHTYDKVNVYSNGLLLFGPVPLASNGDTLGFSSAGTIPKISPPNNIIAIAWTDWSPQMVPDPILFETRGSAPNRKFILQFNKVPEYNPANSFGAISPAAGRLTAQVVLSEGSNDITIYTNQMSTNSVASRGKDYVTQGIENADGSDATFGTFWNSQLNMYQPRVTKFFTLRNDAIRFSPIPALDNVAPVITPAANDSVNTDPGVNFATVVVTPPTVTDNCGDANVTVTGTRSDDPTKPINGVYPVGITTITWTAKDGAGNISTATQIVHVYDFEPPVWDKVKIASVWTKDATSPLGAPVDFGNLPVTDNVGVTSISCEPPSGSVFPIGESTAICTAWDAAGNSAADTIKVVIVNAHDQMGNLIDWVESRGFPDGTVQPLVNQLRAAFDMTAAGESACKKMYDFMSMVQKKNSNISSGDASYMLNAATRILSVLNCAPARNAQVLSQTIRGTVVRSTR